MMYKSLVQEYKDKKSEIHCAIAFICKKISIQDPELLRCKIIISDDFLGDYSRVHSKPDKRISNGITIPPIFQSDAYKQSLDNSNPENKDKTVIIINNMKLTKISVKDYISVIVHELSHCADYTFKLPEFEKKYGIELNNAKSNTAADFIGGYFSSYSETRAKYWQEMFTLEYYDGDDYQNIFFRKERGTDGKVTIGRTYNFDSIMDRNDYYHAQHYAGKIRAWEMFFSNNPHAKHKKEIVERIKKHCLHKCEYHVMINDMYEAWDWDSMLAKCDQILGECNGDTNTIIENME